MTFVPARSINLLLYEFPQPDLDPIEGPSSQRGLLRDKHCSNEKNDDPGSGDKEKKDPDCRKQDAGANEKHFSSGAAAKALAQPELLLEPAAGQAGSETLPALF